MKKAMLFFLFCCLTTGSAFGYHDEYLPYTARWIWAQSALPQPVLEIDADAYIRRFPGGWGASLVSELLNKAANAGYRDVLWVAGNERGLLYPSRHFAAEVVAYPNWQCDFAAFDYPAAVLEVAEQLKLPIAFLVPAAKAADFRNCYPAARITVQGSAKQPSRAANGHFINAGVRHFPAENCRFVRKFEVKGRVEAAEVLVASHGNYFLTVNGTPIGSDADFVIPERYRIAGFLTPGENELVISVDRKADKLTGMLASLTWRDEAGEHRLETDDEWRAERLTGGGYRSAPTIITGLDRAGGRFRFRNAAVAEERRPSVRLQEFDRLLTPDEVLQDGRELKAETAAALFDRSLGDLPNLRIGLPTTLEMRFRQPVRLARIRVYSGYLANSENISSPMSVIHGKLEYRFNGEWKPLAEDAAIPIYAGEGPDFCWQVDAPEEIETTALRLAVLESSDTGKRITVADFDPRRRGAYLREIEVVSALPVAGRRPPAAAGQWRTPVVILAGQSNMDGRNDINLAPAPLREIQPRVRIQYNDYTWRQMRAGNSGFARQTGELLWGPELSFGTSIAPALPGAEQIYLLKSSRGGTNMKHWVRDGAQYKLLQKRIAKLRKDIAKRDPQFIGLVFMQGESDADSEATADAYEANLTAFIAAVRAELNEPALPVVIGQVYTGEGAFKPERIGKIHAAQARVAAAVPRVRLVPTDDLKLKDHVHYDPASAAVLGERFAAALVELLEKP